VRRQGTPTWQLERAVLGASVTCKGTPQHHVHLPLVKRPPNIRSTGWRWDPQCALCALGSPSKWLGKPVDVEATPRQPPLKNHNNQFYKTITLPVCVGLLTCQGLVTV